MDRSIRLLDRQVWPLAPRHPERLHGVHGPRGRCRHRHRVPRPSRQGKAGGRHLRRPHGRLRRRGHRPHRGAETWRGFVGCIETACSMQAADHGRRSEARESCCDSPAGPGEQAAARGLRLLGHRSAPHGTPVSSTPPAAPDPTPGVVDLFIQSLEAPARGPCRVIPPTTTSTRPCTVPARPASPHRSRTRPAEPRPVPPCRGEARRRASPRCAGPATSGPRSRLIHRPQRLRLDRLPRRGRLAGTSGSLDAPTVLLLHRDCGGPVRSAVTCASVPAITAPGQVARVPGPGVQLASGPD
ncbi:hypothetical protein M2158_006054 [Streptomyces sp. SAI-144]|nr:hypothetical protein [Streptomyces sp. SAI-144]